MLWKYYWVIFSLKSSFSFLMIFIHMYIASGYSSFSSCYWTWMLVVIADVKNHPILIHCNKGKVCIVGFPINFWNFRPHSFKFWIVLKGLNLFSLQCVLFWGHLCSIGQVVLWVACERSRTGLWLPYLMSIDDLPALRCACSINSSWNSSMFHRSSSWHECGLLDEGDREMVNWPVQGWSLLHGPEFLPWRMPELLFWQGHR